MNQESVEILNKALNGELLAIYQYLIHSKILNECGLYQLSSISRKSSLDEMSHADKIMDRIFYLKGLPRIDKISGLIFSDNIEEIFKKDLELEEQTVALYKKSISDLEKQNDFGTAKILRHLLVDEESHVDWLQQQLALIEKIGVEKYLEKNG